MHVSLSDIDVNIISPKNVKNYLFKWPEKNQLQTKRTNNTNNSTNNNLETGSETSMNVQII